MKTITTPTEEWKKLLQNDFYPLAKIPSSLVKAYIATAQEHRLDENTLGAYANYTSIPNDNRINFFREALFKYTEVQFMGYREMKENLRMYKMDECSIFYHKDEINKIEEILSKIEIPTANEVRKIMFPILSNALKTKKENYGGGNWIFKVRNNDFKFDLWFDFGGMRHGFDWRIDFLTGQNIDQSFSYENFLGITHPQWNLLSKSNLNEKTKIYVEVLIKTLEIVGYDRAVELIKAEFE